MPLASPRCLLEYLTMNTMRASVVLVLCLFFAGCDTNPVSEGTPPEAAWTHVISIPVATWYKAGPQQGSPPDGQLREGTKVKLIRNAGSYCEIVAETGEVGFVTTDSLREINQ